MDDGKFTTGVNAPIVLFIIVVSAIPVNRKEIIVKVYVMLYILRVGIRIIKYIEFQVLMILNPASYVAVMMFVEMYPVPQYF